MSGIFNTGMTYWQFIGGIVALAFSVVAVKIAIKFDLNKYLERKDKKLDLKMKNTCTHVYMELAGQEDGIPLYKFESLFESPSGTLQWQCQRCGLVRNHNNDYEAHAQYYAQNPNEYTKKNKKFQKLLKKNGAT